MSIYARLAGQSVFNELRRPILLRQSTPPTYLPLHVQTPIDKAVAQRLCCCTPGLLGRHRSSKQGDTEAASRD